MSHWTPLGSDSRPSTQFEAPPFELLDSPLDYVFADHFRQRRICARLKQLTAESRLSPSDMSGLATFLTGDLLIHHQDEDLDIFPVLRRRAEPLDELDAMLKRLSGDHLSLQPLVDEIVVMLRELEEQGDVGIGPALAERLRCYVVHEHKHLVIENGIVLVLARKRLTRADLAAISRSMKSRRGLAH